MDSGQPSARHSEPVPAPRARHTLCDPHPGASDPPAAKTPKGGLSAGGLPRKRGRRSSESSASPGGGGRSFSRPNEVQEGGRVENCQAEVPQMRPAHLPSEHVLLSSPADAAGRRGALLPVLGHRKPAFRACCRGPNLLRRRLGPGRLGRRRLGLAGGALRPDRHAAQPHEVGLETQPPPSPHRGRRERADRGPRRGNTQRQNPRGRKKVRV